jgi:hypothetical protein
MDSSDTHNYFINKYLKVVMNSVSPSDQTMETSEKKVPIKSSVN